MNYDIITDSEKELIKSTIADGIKMFFATSNMANNLINTAGGVSDASTPSGCGLGNPLSDGVGSADNSVGSLVSNQFGTGASNTEVKNKHRGSSMQYRKELVNYFSNSEPSIPVGYDSDLLNTKLSRGTTNNIEDLNQTKSEIKESTKVYDRVYMETESDREPVTREDLSSLSSYFDSDLSKGITNEDVKLRRDLDKKPSELNNVGEYTKDTAIFNGESYPFKRKKKPVDWGRDFDKATPIRNLGILRQNIVNEIKLNFGGFDRITEIMVYQGQLIINRFCYMPILDSGCLDNLPLDSADYFTSNRLAYIFDWSYLTKMRNLDSLYIDDISFYTSVIAVDLGYKRRITTTTPFKICRNLELFVLGTEKIGVSDLVSDKPTKAEKSLAKEMHFNGILDGYKVDVYSCTEGFKNFAFNNLRNYATNRGDKGIVRYCAGTLMQFGVASFAGLLNIGCHFTGGVTKFVRDLVR